MKVSGDFKTLRMGHEDVDAITFHKADRNGYKTGEVDAFLDALSMELREADDYLEWANAEIQRLRSEGGNTLLARRSAEQIRAEANREAREVIRQADEEKRAILAQIDRERRHLEQLKKQEELQVSSNDLRAKLSPSGGAGLSEEFSKTIDIVSRIDADALFDASRLPGYIYDLSPDLEAEAALTRIAFELDVMRVLALGKGSDEAKAQAEYTLTSSFVEPRAAHEFVELFSSYAKALRR